MVDLFVPTHVDFKNEAHLINALRNAVSELTQRHGLWCHAIREFHELGGGWEFMFCKDEGITKGRRSAYITFEEGIELGGHCDKIVGVIYRRLMEQLEDES